ncbi:MAG TPA: hypothetical protein VFM55_18115 [Micromonosporaceae bacterium]|nr:hypothetical protein [Micromonosporaceae bacterium]
MPTSVLLAVLAAAGLLALAPALVRRYDATERLVAERATSTARVLARQRRRRSVPGRHPVNPPRVMVVSLRSATPPSGAVSAAGAGSAPGAFVRPGRPVAGAGRPVPVRRTVPPSRRRPRHTPAVIRRRRVLAALLLLNAVELVGVAVAGPGFWVSVAVTGSLLVLYVVHLRNRALQDRRRRRAEARRAAWLVRRQAEIRQAQERRAAARREAAKRLAAQREAVRREAIRRATAGRAGGGWGAGRAVGGEAAVGGVPAQPYSIRYRGRTRYGGSRAAG